MMFQDLKNKLIYSANLIFNAQPLEYFCDTECDVFLYNECNEQSFISFCDELRERFSFDLINSNEIENNSFRFLKKEKLLVCVGFFRCNNSVRIVIDGNTALPDFQPKSINRKAQTTLWQFEVDHSLIDCGMCYIIRTCTGAFFVVDSAHTYSVNDCERIHDFLRTRTPEGEKIHIAGWFITHGHDDHVAQFTNYLDFYM